MNHIDTQGDHTIIVANSKISKYKADYITLTSQCFFGNFPTVAAQHMLQKIYINKERCRLLIDIFCAYFSSKHSNPFAFTRFDN